MRYRRDVPREADVDSVVEHVRLHLAGAVDYNDDPSAHLGDVAVNVLEHIDGDPLLFSVIGEIDGEPDAHYLRPDFRPEDDHPEVVFTPFEQPDLGRHVDRDALASFRGLS